MASENTNQQEVILKPTGTVYISNRFSLIERKLLNGLIWHSQKNRFSADKATLPLKTVFQLIGLETSRNYDVVKDALKVLIGTVIEWNIFGDDRTQVWGACTFLAGAEIQKGKLSYTINPLLVEKINTPTLFAKVQLLIQSQFRKRHALVLYEFLVDFLCRQKTKKIIIDDVSIEKIYTLLGIGDDEYKAFKEFNRKVLKPSVQEMNEFSDLSVDYKTIRKNRKVAAVKFIIERKDSFRITLDFQEDDSLTDIRSDSMDKNLTPEQKQLYEQLIFKGVNFRQAKRLVTQFPADRIKANIDLVSNKQTSGSSAIGNVAAYLVCAIEDDYRSKASPEDEKAEQVRIEVAATREKAERRQLQIRREVECVQANFWSQQTKLIDARLSKMDQKERDNLDQEFMKAHSMWAKKFRETGLETPTVRAVFYSFAIERMLSSEERNIVQFATSAGVSTEALQLLLVSGC